LPAFGDNPSVPLTDSADYFQTLGRVMGERLGAHPAPDDVFADIATSVLHEIDAPKIDVLAMADWAAVQRPLPKQVNFASGFGQPPLVVFEAPGFYIEVLFWFPSKTSIHGHGFTGAFRVLDGYSVQVEYRFEQTEAPDEAVRLGRVVPQGIEMIAQGRICPILQEDEFIHTVAHMGNPSLTLVARTPGNAKELQQFTYFRCGYAHLSHHQRQSVARHVDVLDALFKARPDQFLGRLIDFLAASDSAMFFKVVRELPFRLTLPVFSARILPGLRQRFGQSHPFELAALDEVIRSHGLWGMMALMKEPRKQLLLALSELFPDPQVRDDLICRSFNVTDAGPVLEDWLQIAERA
jgi:hypothetical protein